MPIVGDAKNVLSSLNNVLKDYESNEDAKKWVKLLIERKKECFPRVTYDDIPLKQFLLHFHLVHQISIF